MKIVSIVAAILSFGLSAMCQGSVIIIGPGGGGGGVPPIPPDWPGTPNSAPVAAFTRTPTNVFTLTEITFDAGTSTDDQGAGQLSYRWDWNNDGVFDTAYMNNPVATYRYDIAGSKTVVLQVKDSNGALGTVAQNFDVFMQHPPETQDGNAPAFELQFGATDLVFDPVRPYAYAIGSYKKLVMVNLTNGLIEQQFTFIGNPYNSAQTPKSLALSPDNRKLYVALVCPDGMYPSVPNTPNHIAEFDLLQRTKIKDFELSTRPNDIAVTDNGILVAAGASLQLFRISDGQLLDTENYVNCSAVSIHPSQQAIYSTRSTPPGLNRYRFDPITGEFDDFRNLPNPEKYAIGSDLFCSPDGDHLLTRGGSVFTTSSKDAQDLQHLQTLPKEVKGASFDQSRQVVFTVGGNQLSLYRLDSLSPILTRELTNDASYVHATGEKLFLAWIHGPRTFFSMLSNPALGAETNQSPMATFSLASDIATTLSAITFDASGSTDDQCGAAGLEYRWDWNNDGNFDTAFTNNPVALHRYNIPGAKSVTLQVKDYFGAIATATRTFTVAEEIDPGLPCATNVSYEIPFAATDITFDPIRPTAYVCGNKTLDMMNLTNGLIEREFQFDWDPGVTAVARDGKRMYVALPCYPSAYVQAGQTNYVAEFDLEQGVKTREFEIYTYPRDMAATDSGILIVCGGDRIQAYRVSSGRLLWTKSGDFFTSISLHPSQNAIYAATSDLPRKITRFQIDPNSGMLISSTDVPFDELFLGQDVFCLVTGNHLVTQAGRVLTTSPDPLQDLKHVLDLANPFKAVSSDLARHTLFTIFDNRLDFYNFNSLHHIGAMAFTNPFSYIHAMNEYVYLARTNGPTTVFTNILSPVLGSETNDAPVAAFVRSPSTVTTLSTVNFDASSSTDDNCGGTTLNYRWDWESDGIFDTPFMNEPTAIHHFNTSGAKTVTLQVADVFGVVGNQTQTFEVALEADPGSPVGTNVSYEIPFVATDVVFDSARPYAYICGYDEKTLVMLNLTNGFIERQFHFDWKPSCIAISSASRKMYVHLCTKDHFDWSPNEIGYIAEFDLDLKVKTKEFEIQDKVYDLAVTDNGIVFVVGPTNANTGEGAIRSYRASTGEFVGSYPCNGYGYEISAHPSQSAVYTLGPGYGTDDIVRYNFEPQTGVITSSWYRCYYYPLGAKLFCMPDGVHLLSQKGRILTSSPREGEDMGLQTTLSGGDLIAVSFAGFQNAFFTVGGPFVSGAPSLCAYDSRTFKRRFTTTLAYGAEYVHATPQAVYIGWKSATTTFFQSLKNPLPQGLVITRQPQSKSVTGGTTARMSIGVQSAEPPTYQWFFAGNPLNGQTSSTLTIPNARPVHSGVYWVTVSNSQGKVSSVRVNLVVDARPTITLLSPSAGQRTETLSICGSATDDFGIAQVRYWFTNFNNGARTVSPVREATLSGPATNLTWAGLESPLPGTNVIVAEAVDSFGNTIRTSRKFFYAVPSELTVLIRGDGTGTVSIANLPPHPIRDPEYPQYWPPWSWLYIGEAYSLSVSSDYLSKFVGWVGPWGTNTNTTLRFVMQPGLTVEARFTNTLEKVAGTYNGLFYERTNVTMETAGMLQNFVVTPKGAYTGRLFINGSSYNLSGSLNGAGATYGILTNAGRTLEIRLRAHRYEPGYRFMNGAVREIDLAKPLWDPTNGTHYSSEWYALLHADVAGQNTSSASYVVSILSSGEPNSPRGQTFGSVRINAGVASLSLALPDRNVAAQTVPVAKDGRVPVYVDLYNHQGLLEGWISMTNGLTGQLVWIKKPGSASYPGGFTNTVSIQSQ